MNDLDQNKNWEPITPVDEVFTMKEFSTLCKNGDLVDCDGWGYYARNIKQDKWGSYTGEFLHDLNIQVMPSIIKNGITDIYIDLFSHIVWFGT